MDYNELKLSIYESFNNGEIDEIEKDILLERLEEKYYEDNEEDITLEEAMDTISSYLSEKTSSIKKYKQYEDKIESLTKKYESLEKIAKDAERQGKRDLCNKANRDIRKIQKQILREIDVISAILDGDYQVVNDKYDGHAMNAHRAGREASRLKAKLRDYRKKYGDLNVFNMKSNIDSLIQSGKKSGEQIKFRGNSKREPEIKGKYKTTNGLKESVDDLKLDVYESFNNGNITEEEKNMFLEYLNLDNYS